MSPRHLHLLRGEISTTVYHKGPGVKKSGPKGPRTVKGPVLDAILSGERLFSPNTESCQEVHGLLERVGRGYASNIVKKILSSAVMVWDS